jgi:hypothetical protein
MGNGPLSKLPASPVQTPAVPEQLNDYYDALTGDILMRDPVTGLVSDGIGNVGTPSDGRPDYVHVKTGISIGGIPILASNLQSPPSCILDGASNSDGSPSFMSVTGSATGVSILATTTPLNMLIRGLRYSLTADYFLNLPLAPASNNTCTVNDSFLSSQEFTKTIGEYGYVIKISSVGSNITALNGKYAAFKIGSGPEVFLALVDTTNGQLIPYVRGFGATARSAFSNGATVTLLSASWVFLRNDLITYEITSTRPVYSYTAPSSPADGDYWQDLNTKLWNRYSSSAVQWQEQGDVLLGVCVSDSSYCKWREMDDFFAVWKSDLLYTALHDDGAALTTILKLDGPLHVSVFGKDVSIPENLTLDISTIIPGGESLLASAWHYIYIDQFGNFYVSATCPRTSSIKSGIYHPSKYWRAIGCFYVNVSSKINGFFYDFASGIDHLYFTLGFALTINSPGDSSTFTSNFMPIPPLVKTVRGLITWTATSNASTIKYDLTIQTQDMLVNHLYTPISSQQINLGSITGNPNLPCVMNFNDRYEMQINNCLIKTVAYPASGFQADSGTIYAQELCVKF